MKKVKILTILLCSCIFLQAQNGISGYLNLDDPENWESEVMLYEVDMHGNELKVKDDLLARATIDESGYFEFSGILFHGHDRFYKIEIKNIEDQFLPFPNYKIFILNNTDSLYFHKGNQLFGHYTNSNLADLEWQKFNQFESKLNLNDEAIFQKKYKPYVKDSLQILMVKLISIKQLKDKQLLEKDIRENHMYYLELLADFQSSDLDPSDYAQLENKLAKIELSDVNQKYKASLVWNGIAGFLILGLFFSWFQLRKKVNNQHIIQQIPLSKQEENIKKLILQGKSNKEIASDLFISISTVKTHITNLYKKLGVRNRKEILMQKTP